MQHQSGNRDYYTHNEVLPMFEAIKLKHAGKPWQVRFNFSESIVDEDTDQARTTLNYSYADVEELTPACLSEAGIPQPIIDAICQPTQ